MKLLAIAFPDRTNVVVTERYFKKGLREFSANHERREKNADSGETYARCKGTGRTVLDVRESTVNVNKNPMEEGTPNGRGGVIASLP